MGADDTLESEHVAREARRLVEELPLDDEELEARRRGED